MSGGFGHNVNVQLRWRDMDMLGHEVRLPDGTLAASGRTVLVAWDPVARGKRILSDAERVALS